MTTQALELSRNFYNLFQSLPDEVKHSFLKALVQNKREELESAFFYWECKVAKEEGFLSDEEANDFLLSLPQ